MVPKILKNLVKRNKSAFLIFLNIFRRNAGFHSDKMAIGIVKEINEFFPITSFIETGTYRGDSSLTMARNFPELPIYTCEVAEEFFAVAKERLKHYPGVKIFHQSSEKFLEKLSPGETGSLPLFFLDAHWYDYWPLADELRIIDSKFDKAVIIVDDFQIPGREEFKYQKNRINRQLAAKKMSKDQNVAMNHEGGLSDDKPCNFDFVRDKFRDRIDVLYPDYYRKGNGAEGLTGYGILFKNLNSFLPEFIENHWVKDNFKLISNNERN